MKSLKIYRYRDLKEHIYFLMIALTYKLALELGLWYVLQEAYKDANVYKFDFSIGKYIYGMVWVLILFVLIKHDTRKPSTFFLQFQYLLAVIPITVIFAFSDEKVLYYTAVCAAFAFAEMLIASLKDIKIPQIKVSSKILIIGFYLITVIVYADMILENGMFTLEALNIYSVYEVRTDFELNKYVWYMFYWQYMIITPFFIIRAYKRKKFFSMLFFCILQLVAYLYAAQKALLFIIPLVVGVCVISSRKKFGRVLFLAWSAGTALVTIGSVWSETIYRIYDLFVRRVLILPANLKFIYYDFFSQNPKIGLAGTLWGKFLDLTFPYEERIGILISTVYFDRPEMNSNTGFLAEGYYRFGYFGIFLALILFAFVLIILDHFAKLNGYSFTVSMSFFSILLLNDGSLIDPLIFGPFTILVVLCLFYNVNDDFKSKKLVTHQTGESGSMFKYKRKCNLQL